MQLFIFLMHILMLIEIEGAWNAHSSCISVAFFLMHLQCTLEVQNSFQILKWSKPHFVLCLERTDIEYLISSFVNDDGYWHTPNKLANGKCSAAFISCSLGSISNFSSAGDKGIFLSFGPLGGRNSLNRSTALVQ